MGDVTATYLAPGPDPGYFEGTSPFPITGQAKTKAKQNVHPTSDFIVFHGDWLGLSELRAFKQINTSFWLKYKKQAAMQCVLNMW